MNNEIFKLAAQADPERMTIVAEALEVAEKIDPGFATDILQDFNTIAEFTQEKVASASGGGALKTGLGMAAKGALAVGGAVGAALGTHIAADLFDAAKRGLTKAKDFKRIMDANPQIKNEVIDKSRIKPSFDALHRFAPDFMRDPLIGGSLLKSVANQPSGNEYQLITALISSRKNLDELKSKNFNVDLREVAKNMVSHRAAMELKGAEKAPLHYHQHFGGKKVPKGTPLAIKND